MKWLDLRIGAQKWSVYIVSEKSKRLQPDGPGAGRNMGVTYYDEGRIYIAREQSETIMEDTLLHELLHAVLRTSRGSSELGDPKREERIVERITPLLHMLLKDLGFRFPKGTAL